MRNSRATRRPNVHARQDERGTDHVRQHVLDQDAKEPGPEGSLGEDEVVAPEGLRLRANDSPIHRDRRDDDDQDDRVEARPEQCDDGQGEHDGGEGADGVEAEDQPVVQPVGAVARQHSERQPTDECQPDRDQGHPERDPPWRTRANRSRPRWSVPRGCWALGGWSRSRGSSAVGSKGLKRSAPSGSRQSRPRGRARRPVRAVRTAGASPRAIAAVAMTASDVRPAGTSGAACCSRRG
jgi:hypothetical protein